MGTLREQMLAEMQLKRLTQKTQKIYLREVRNYRIINPPGHILTVSV
jgi:hypothetical protein